MIERVDNPGAEAFSPAKRFGELLKQRLEKDPTFYVFSPDETTSNKLDKVFETSDRLWNLPKKDWDLPEAENGRIVELLSENTLFAAMVGHILNNEPAVMTSYESFFPIVTSQILQQIKFFEQSDAVEWRPKYPSLNLLSTSTCWRQDHNGFSHQSPALISTLLALPSNRVNCLFPVDDVAVEPTFDFMLSSKNVVNLTTFDKNLEPRWIDSYHADFLFKNGGASVFKFISDESPDFIFTAAGDITTREAIFAIRILKEDVPEIKIRFVGINALSYNAIGTTDNKLSHEIFNDYFTTDRPIIANFHGYPETLRNILVHYANQDRLSVHGFVEKGSTTTPFEMLAWNGASRYNLAIDVAEKLGRTDLVEKYQKILNENSEYAKMFGVDKIDLI
ncbi:hypothetical protein IJI94_00810 [Candidatus Saccharibacteria bacterium]|nr:hypothetical protein [Candidatus Saccharibacteria bacterium]